LQVWTKENDGRSRRGLRPPHSIFTRAGVDPDAAFAKALAAVPEADAEASKTGRPAHIVFNLDKTAT
jgi:hypothetical protein